MTKLFLETFKSKIGTPILPPSEHFNLFFFRTCSINLQVVDLPLVPVTIILFDLIFLRKINQYQSIFYFCTY